MTRWILKLDDLRKVRFRLEGDGALLWVILDDPPGNVLDSEMMTSLRPLVVFIGAYGDEAAGRNDTKL